MVRAAHALALKLGGADKGAPGPWPQNHAACYGACLRDPDGNKLAVACHVPPP